ncbi:hypothetical protein HK102_009019, partial [Quaeritorhiza haematococci]
MNQMVVNLMKACDDEEDYISDDWSTPTAPVDDSKSKQPKTLLHASEKAMNGYCLLLHLLTTLTLHTPEIAHLAWTRATNFLNSPSHRQKSHTPNLGELLVMLMIAPLHDRRTCTTCAKAPKRLVRNPVQTQQQPASATPATCTEWWEAMKIVFVKEMLARNVVFALDPGHGNCPHLAYREQTNVPFDKVRLEDTFKCSMTSVRLLLFQVFFLTSVAPYTYTSGAAGAQGSRLGMRYGFPEDEIVTGLAVAARGIYEVDSFPAFFQKLEGMSSRARSAPAPSSADAPTTNTNTTKGTTIFTPAWCTNILRQSLVQSEKSNYHTVPYTPHELFYLRRCREADPVACGKGPAGYTPAVDAYMRKKGVSVKGSFFPGARSTSRPIDGGEVLGGGKVPPPFVDVYARMVPQRCSDGNVGASGDVTSASTTITSTPSTPAPWMNKSAQQSQLATHPTTLSSSATASPAVARVASPSSSTSTTPSLTTTTTTSSSPVSSPSTGTSPPPTTTISLPMSSLSLNTSPETPPNPNNSTAPTLKRVWAQIAAQSTAAPAVSRVASSSSSASTTPSLTTITTTSSSPVSSPSTSPPPTTAVSLPMSSLSLNSSPETPPNPNNNTPAPTLKRGWAHIAAQSKESWGFQLSRQ